MGSRIAEVLSELGQKQTWLCAKAGIDAGTLSALIKRDSKTSEYSSAIAEALGINEKWLNTGIGPKFNGQPKVQQTAAAYNVLDPGGSRRPVPVIDFVKASDFADINCHFEPGEGDRFETPDYKLGPRGWAHIVDGPSMDDGTPRGIPDGWIIWCDPDLAAQPNSLVIAKNVDMQRATFKQLTYEDGQWFLRPLNRQFPIIPIDDPKLRVIAVVTEARPPSRRLT